MHFRMSIVSLLNFLLLFIFACKKIYEPVVNYTYFEGQQIPGTEVFFPLGYYSGGSQAARPKISPDGNYIAYNQFYADSNEATGLYIMNLGTLEKQLLIAGFVRNPDWSPDGKWVAFNEGVHIYKIKSNGDSLTTLTTIGRNFFPDWSPDGQRIVYDRSLADSAGPEGVWMMRSDGSEKKWLAKGNFPKWHPSGQSIVTVLGTSTDKKKIVIYRLAADSVTQIIEVGEGRDYLYPEFSPLGSQLVFWSPEGIWIANTNGSILKRIIPSNLYNDSSLGAKKLFVFAPSWYPDSKHIMYEHYQTTRVEDGIDGIISEGYYSFYMVDVDQALAASNLP